MQEKRSRIFKVFLSLLTAFVFMALCAGSVFAYTSNQKYLPGERILSVVPVTTSAGFNPSSGNNLEIRVTTSLPSGGNARIKISILNSKGEWVYSKTYSGVNKYFMIKTWNGKPSSGNKANLPTTKYVPAGTYTVSASYITSSGTVKSTKKRSFKVSKSAPSGKSGIAKRELKPVYVGYGCMDYFADVMIKAAGVKSTDSVDTKIKKVYHYMTLNFKHVHNLAERPVKYNITKNNASISSYNDAVWKEVKNGRASFMYTSTLAAQQNHMLRRGGQCNNHSAIFMLLCYHMGIPGGYCTGYYHNSNGTLAAHYWPFLIVNGTKYYYDIDIEIQNLGKGQGDYYWYKWDQAKADKKYTFNTEYNPGK